MEQPTTQPRIPGVRYRTVKRKRPSTTVIDGVASTRQVEYEAVEPVPPRDWDTVILRGVITVAVVVTLIAIVGTTASVGGLLRAMVPAGVAYGMGAVFTAVWMACLGLEWLNRVNPAAAKPARNGGRVALLVSMAAVVAYGHVLGEPVAGVVGACMDLGAKVLWGLVIGYHAVPLDEGIAHWVTEQEQKLAGRELLGARLARLNRRAAYQLATGGQEVHAAAAIMASADTAGQRQDTVPDTSAVVVVPAPVPVPATTPDTHAPDTHGHTARTVSEQVSTPPAPPAPPVSGHPADTTDTPVTDTSAQGGESTQASTVQQITTVTIAGTIRAVLREDLGISDDDLTIRVAAVHGDSPQLAETVRRTRDRIVNPKPKKRKRAS